MKFLFGLLARDDDHINRDVNLSRQVQPNTIFLCSSNRFYFPLSVVSNSSLCLFSVFSGQSLKRSRNETPQHELEKVVTSQANEIQSLKADKQKVETSFTNLESEHGRVLNENRILKKAVTIQQERQNQAASEIDAAHKYKFDAEERIKKLEQIILSLRYHLQAQQSSARNDFMGCPPPNVY